MIPLHDDNSTNTPPIINITLIVVCSVVFLWQIYLDEKVQVAVVLSLGVIPATLIGGMTLPPELYWVPPEITLFTSMFLHGGWMHLIGNMLYLWIFGNNIEDAMGHVRFIIFYLLCGAIAALSQAIPDANSIIPMIGASGAIAGILGAYLLLYPRAQILVLIPLGPFSRLIYLPAMVVLGLWFILQLINSFFTESEGGVAWGAHIGGFIAGMVLIPIFKQRHIPLLAPPRHHY
jgi:membrane associated rhomboid family serine protease